MADKEKAKKKGEFEKMGDLNKGVGGEKKGTEEKKESTDDIINEIESFDATKSPPPGNDLPASAGSAPEAPAPETPEPDKAEAPAAEPKKEEKSAGDDFEKMKKELDREKDKNKNLAKIIETVSTSKPEVKEKVVEKVVEKPGPADIGPQLSEMESKMKDQFSSEMKDIKNAIVAIGNKVEEVSKTSAKPERTGSKVKDMVDKAQADTSKKIAEIEESMKAMIDKMEVPKKEEDVSKGLAAIGGNVGMKNQILEMRSLFKDLDKGLNELRDETDRRITRVKEQMKAISKIPTIEEKLDGLVEKMSPGNIEKLKKFVFSADEITSDLIPNEIEKRMTKGFTPVFNDIKDIRDDIEKVNENIKTIFNETNFFKGELKTVYKFGDYISQLQTEKEKLAKKIGENEAGLISMINRVEEILKKKTSTLNEKLEEFEKVFTGRLETMVKDCFDDLTESKFLELEDRTEKNLAVSRAQVNDMLSRFVQFQNVVDPSLSLLKEELERTNKKFDKLAEHQEEFEEDVEQSVKETFAETAEPKINDIWEETKKFSEAVNGRFDDFQAEFVQFQNVINPTLRMIRNDLSKTDSKLEKLGGRHDDLKSSVNELKDIRKTTESMKEIIKSIENKQNEMDRSILVLGSKLGELDEEFNGVVKQSMIDKKKLDDNAKKQKERVNILLKELKGA